MHFTALFPHEIHSLVKVSLVYPVKLIKTKYSQTLNLLLKMRCLVFFFVFFLFFFGLLRRTARPVARHTFQTFFFIFISNCWSVKNQKQPLHKSLLWRGNENKSYICFFVFFLRIILKSPVRNKILPPVLWTMWLDTEFRFAHFPILPLPKRCLNNPQINWLKCHILHMFFFSMGVQY